jgi:DNA-directed RNA polymerase subunit RPC12/RpoP
MPMIKILGYKCSRCEHQWIPRSYKNKKKTDKPRVCPRCKNPYWDKEKTK